MEGGDCNGNAHFEPRGIWGADNLQGFWSTHSFVLKAGPKGSREVEFAW